MRTTFATIGLAALVGLTAACGVNDRNEPDVKTMAEDALRAEGIEDVRVTHDNDARVVHLRGTVASPQIRERAETSVQRAVGATTRVANEVVVEGRHEDMAGALDSGIKEQLNVLRDDHPVLKDRDVDFEVNNGVVTIKGEVRTAAERQQAEQMAKQVQGPTEVINALEVRASKS